MSPVLFGAGTSARTAWFYFTENELTPGAVRQGNYKAVCNLRGDSGQAHGRPRRGLEPGRGKGQEKPPARQIALDASGAPA
jgi:hypothetical protein